MKKLIKRLFNSLGSGITKTNEPFDMNSERRDLEFYFNLAEGSISLQEARLLYDLAKNVKNNCIVEIGSYRGLSTVALGRGSIDGSQVPVFAIEPHEVFTGVLGGEFGPQDRGAFFKAMLDTSCYQIVRLINLSSETVAPGWDRKVSLLWIDGDHRYEGVKRDFYCWSPHLTSDAIIAFHDSINPQLGPRRLIAELFETGNFRQIHQVDQTTVIKSN